MSADAPELHAEPPQHPAAALDHEAVCPLCDYSLRGLTDPRCPECGHQFEWVDVLRPEAEVRWLYEHATSPGTRAFARTAIRSIWPPGFWRRLKTVHAVRPVRLWGYLGRVVALTLALAMVLAAYWTTQGYLARTNERARQMKRLVGWQQSPQQMADWLRASRGITPQEYIDRYWPAPDSLDVASNWLLALTDWQILRWQRPGAHLIGESRTGLLRCAGLAIAWPLLTLATFAIFRVSFRLAGLKWTHVLRLVGYSATFATAAPLLWLLMEFAQPWRFSILPYGWDAILGLQSARGCALYLTTLLLAGALLLGATRYLRIPAGGAMAASSQMIVLLLLVLTGLYAE